MILRPGGNRPSSERLSAVDAAFLHAERDGGHAHIGAIASFSGIPPQVEDLRRHVASRLHLVPRYGQRLHRPWPGARPMWVDHAELDLDYHIQAVSLAPDSGEEGLRRFAERIFSQRLDRSKPLWEIWLVDGFAEGRFALINKSHHSLLDGVSGVGVAGAILDLDPEARPAATPRWSARPVPSSLEVGARDAQALVAAIGRGRRLPVAALRDVRGRLRRVREAAAGAAELVTLALTGASREPISRPIDPERRVRWLTVEFADLDQVKEGLGGTINDAFVSTVAGALGAWLRRLGVDTFGLRPRALIPVSTRNDQDRATMGNRLTTLVVPLPLDLRHPRTRHEAVREVIERAKRSSQAAGAEAVLAVEELVSGPLLALSSRAHFWNRFYSVLATNVPGPPVPLYLLGRRLEELVPVPLLLAGQSLAFAFLSYDGRATVAMMTDGRGADLELLTSALGDAHDELVSAAGGRSRRRRRIRTNRFESQPEKPVSAVEPPAER